MDGNVPPVLPWVAPVVSGSVRVRRASVDDAPALVRLCTQLGYPTQVAVMRHRLSMLVEHPDHLVLLAEAESPAGCVAAEYRRALEFDEHVELMGLVVDQAHRRAGVGRALVDAVEAWADARGAASVLLRSNAVRPEAHAFYPDLGYQCIKTQQVYLKRLRVDA